MSSRGRQARGGGHNSGQSFTSLDINIALNPVADANSSTSADTSAPTSSSQVLTTTATTTLTTEYTNTATPSIITIISSYPDSQNDNSLQHDSIIISSAMGSFTILFITALAITFIFYKRRKRQRELDYSPPFTSLAPPPRSALSRQTVRSSDVQQEEPRETSLSMGPGVYNGATQSSHPLHQHPQVTSSKQSRPADRDSPSQNIDLPTITLRPSSSHMTLPIQPNTPPPHKDDRSGRQSQLYHDALREESEYDAARRRGLEAGVRNAHRTQRPMSGLSVLSDISNIDTGQLRPSGDQERRGRGVFPLTRASSGVFGPDE